MNFSATLYNFGQQLFLLLPVSASTCRSDLIPVKVFGFQVGVALEVFPASVSAHYRHLLHWPAVFEETAHPFMPQVVEVEVLDAARIARLLK